MYILILFTIIQLHVIPDIVENVSDSSVFRGLFFQLEPQTLIVKQNLDEKRMANIYQSLVRIYSPIVT